MSEITNRESEPPALKLSDLVDISLLQEIQDWFASFTGISVAIRDPDNGSFITKARMRNRFCEFITGEKDGAEYCRKSNRKAACDAIQTEEPTKYVCHAGLTQFTAPITVNGKILGLLVIGDRPEAPLSSDKIQEVADRLNLDRKMLQEVADKLQTWSDDDMRAAIQFLSSTANAVANLCYQGYQLQKRVEELSGIRDISQLVTSARGLQEVLNVIAESATRLLDVKGCSINLIDEETNTLSFKALYNLSKSLLEKQPLSIPDCPTIQQVIKEKRVVCTEDVTTIPGFLTPAEAQKEGICSVFSACLTAKNKAIGTIHAYTAEPYKLTEDQVAFFQSIASHAAIAIEKAKLYEESLEMHRMEQELSLASAVQLQLLPQRCPYIEGYQIAATCMFSYQYKLGGLGGDFYDFIPLRNSNLGIVIADVSGKSVPSAILMATARSVLRAQAENIGHPDEVIERVNQILCRDTREEEFVTMVYATLDPKCNRLIYTNAGHNPPLLVRNGEVTLLETGGMIVGFLEDAEYDEDKKQLMPGDTLFFYTDGATEAKNANGEEFGVQHLHQVVQDNASLEAEAVNNKVLAAVHTFVGGETLNDDMTMVTVKVIE